MGGEWVYLANAEKHECNWPSVLDGNRMDTGDIWICFDCDTYWVWRNNDWRKVRWWNILTWRRISQAEK